MINDWYIVGCKELRDYFRENNISYLVGNENTIGYFINDNGKWDHSPLSCVQCLERKEISFDELLSMKEDEFVLPDKWCIRITKENRDVVKDWMREHVLNTTQNFSIGWYYSNQKHDLYSYNIEASKHSPIYTEITFKQFKKYVLKQDEMNKVEIIGYKLIKPEYLDACIKINGTETCYLSHNPDDNYLSYKAKNVIRRLKNAGVLDLWFKPIYKEAEYKFTLSNGKTVTIKDGKVYGEDRVFYMVDLQHIIKNEEGEYRYQLENGVEVYAQDVILKIGCWEGVKLSEVKMILNKLENQ